MEFHFDGKGSHYLIAKDIIKDKSEIAYSDKILKEKYNHMRLERINFEKIQIELKKNAD